MCQRFVIIGREFSESGRKNLKEIKDLPFSARSGFLWIVF